jgi:uncharacterized protein (UPF0548 family)
VISLRRVGPSRLDALLAKACLASPTYAPIGASRDENLPRGFHHVRVEERIGDAAAFDRAIAALRTWVAHEGSGLSIYPHEPVVPGATVIAVTSVGLMHIVAPCRIVAVFKEPDSFGFAYGTLPGHPESGEESFIVERRDDATYFCVSAFSRPVDPWARLAGPVGRAVQRSVTRHYVNALRRFVEAGSSANETPVN